MVRPLGDTGERRAIDRLRPTKCQIDYRLSECAPADGTTPLVDPETSARLSGSFQKTLHRFSAQLEGGIPLSYFAVH
jgi:hypothetical protein